MSVFGQVWLYSLAAFFLGVLLTWLVLVRPLRTRVRELERRVVAHRSELVTTAPEVPPQQQEEWISDTAAADQAFAELDAVLPTAEGPDSTPFDEHDPAVVAGGPDDAGGTASVGIAAVLASGDQPNPGTETPADVPAEPSRGLFQPALPNTDPEDEPATPPAYREPEVPGDEEPAADSSSAGDSSGAGVSSSAEASSGAAEAGAGDGRSTTGALPKRQRREAHAGGFDPPEPIQPSMRPMAPREPTPQPGRHSGSLFEPDDTAAPLDESADHAAPAEPGSVSDAADGPVGPFGYGSAMPLPGGGRPSEAFTVKASVTTLRYCMPDSVSFPEMVAEVWFRSAQDAERVGFRPIG